MPKQACKTIFGTSLKVAAVPIIMVANALIWYFYYFGFVGDIINTAGFSNVESLTIWGISFLVLALSALFSATLLNRTKSRNTFLFYWLSVGVIFSLIPLAIDITQFNLIIIFSFFGNMYFGLGMPICFGYFATVTEARNRSRMSGITFLCVFLGFFFLSVLNINEIALNSLVLAVWKFSGFAALLLIKPEEEKVFQSSRESYISILKKRPFLLYFTSWLMFSVVNYLAIPIISNSFTKVFGSDTFMYILESVLAAGFAVVFGFLGDYVGRKRLTVTGFILLGVGYASLGLFPKSITGQWFYLIVDGIAWGAFYTIFLMTLWGDLADGTNSEKYYAIGSLPYLFSNFMLISMGSYISDLVAQSAIFSFVSVFLFLAVLPLIYAPETLPEKIVKERELKTYLEKAQEEAEKAQKKKNENTQTGNISGTIEFEVCDGMSNEPENNISLFTRLQPPFSMAFVTKVSS